MTSPTLVLSVGVLLVGMVLIAPLIRGNLFLHRIDMLAAALPGDLSAYLAGSGSTHDRLLRLSRLDPLVGPAAWCCELPLSGWGSSSLIVLMIPLGYLKNEVSVCLPIASRLRKLRVSNGSPELQVLTGVPP